MSNAPHFFRPGSATTSDERGNRFVVQFETPYGAFAMRSIDEKTEEILVRAASAQAARHMYDHWFMLRWDDNHHYRRKGFCDKERGIFRCLVDTKTTWGYVCYSSDCRRAISALTMCGDKVNVKKTCNPFIRDCLNKDKLLASLNPDVRGANRRWSISALCDASWMDVPGVETMPCLVPG